MSHTIGPWEAKGISAGGMRTIVALSADFLQGHLVAVVAFVNDCFPKEQVEANVKLIAAAPELLEACKMAYRSARVVHGEQSEVCVQLLNVIAKVEGEHLHLALPPDADAVDDL